MTLRREWTPHELMRAKAMRSNGTSFAAIDKSLGRRVGSTQGKLTYLASQIHRTQIEADHQLSGLRAPPSVLIERDARKEASYRRDLTATLCGDPPRGFSELDRRRPHLVKTDRGD